MKLTDMRNSIKLIDVPYACTGEFIANARSLNNVRSGSELNNELKKDVTS